MTSSTFRLLRIGVLQDILLRVLLVFSLVIGAVAVIAVPVAAQRLKEGIITRSADCMRCEGRDAVVLRRDDPLPEASPILTWL